MAWLWRRRGRVPGKGLLAAPGGASGDPSELSNTTTAVLKSAGWRPDRAIDLSALEAPLAAAGFAFHDKARAFLTEYGLLEMLVPVNGAPGVTGFVQFDPRRILPFWEPERDNANLAALAATVMCPIGSTSGHTVYLFMGEDGAVYLLDWEWSFFAPLAPNVPASLELLCDGRNGRVDSIGLVDGRLGNAVYTDEDEQSRWGLHEFPDIVSLLPPCSFEPGRRPPTCHALPRVMQRAAEQGRSAGAADVRQRLQRFMFSSGGIKVATDRRPFFVAHTENSLVIRRDVPLQVAGPPADIRTLRLRPGECVPTSLSR
jgi:hypothetical protein